MQLTIIIRSEDKKYPIADAGAAVYRLAEMLDAIEQAEAIYPLRLEDRSETAVTEAVIHKNGSEGRA